MNSADPSMNPDLWPKDSLQAAARCGLVVLDIQERNDTDRNALLAFFMRSAWPTPRTARQ